MIRLIINEKEAVLPADTEIVTKLRNRIFDPDLDDATWPFTLPLRANRHIFGYPDRITTNVKTTTYPAVLYCGAYVILDGMATITDISTDEVELFLSFSFRNFWNKMSDKTIDTYGPIMEPDRDSKREYLYSSLNNHLPFVACPLYDPSMTRVPKWDLPLGEMFPYFINPRTDRPCAFIPFPRLAFILTTCIQDLGYKIRRNDLERIPDFNNILIICRREYYILEYLPIDLRNYLPKIPVTEFLQDIERKFGVIFLPDEHTKKIDIVSFDAFEKHPPVEIRTEDTISREILMAEDRSPGFWFYDELPEDSYLNNDYFNNHVDYDKFGHKDPEQNVTLEEIKCISAPIGYDRQQRKSAINYGDTSTVPDEDENRKKEFRLAVYQGAGSGLMSSEIQNDILKWKTLYETCHERRCKVLMNRQETVEMNLYAPPLKMLRDIQSLFRSYVINRNNRFAITEQEITLSSAGIVSWTVRGIPC